MKVQIKPVVKEATSLDMDVLIIDSPVEGSKAHVSYKIVGEGIMIPGVLIIEGAEYDAWGSDDNYLYDLILSKLGLERA
jgi:hypothetical protein